MTMNFHLRDGYGQGGGPQVTLRCPACRKHAVFLPIGGVNDVSLDRPGGPFHVGLRTCPDPKCKALLLVIVQKGNVVASVPPELIDFDATGLPPRIVASLSEAIACHANQCYVASAMLLRKTLELLCDEQKATGDNLKKRVVDLATKIVAPKALIDAIDHLRLLGNDAAHVNAVTFDSIGRKEIEVSLDFTKEVLKAVYQLKELVAKLVALQSPGPP